MIHLPKSIIWVKAVKIFTWSKYVNPVFSCTETANRKCRNQCFPWVTLMNSSIAIYTTSAQPTVFPLPILKGQPVSSTSKASATTSTPLYNHQNEWLPAPAVCNTQNKEQGSLPLLKWPHYCHAWMCSVSLFLLLHHGALDQWYTTRFHHSRLEGSR